MQASKAKKGLVISGAGPHALWEAGAITELLEFCWEPEQGGEGYDHIFGTSAGSISAAYVAQFPKETCHSGAASSLAAIWKTAAPIIVSSGLPTFSWSPFGILRYLAQVVRIWLRLLTGGSLFDSAAIRSLVERLLDPLRLSRSGVYCHCNAADISTMQTCRFIMAPDDALSSTPRGLPDEQIMAILPRELASAVVASSAVPLLFSPVHIDVGYVPFGVHRFIDGGAYDMILMEAALSICDEVHVISSFNVTDRRLEYAEPPLSLLEQAWSIMRAFEFVWRRHTRSNIAALLQVVAPVGSTGQPASKKRVLYIEPRIGDVRPSYADWVDPDNPVLEMSFQDGITCAQLAIDAAYGPGTAPSSRRAAGGG